MTPKRELIEKKNQQIDRMADLAIDIQKDLTAANKAIVAMADALDVQINQPLQCVCDDCQGARETLKAHAPAIEKARGG